MKKSQELILTEHWVDDPTPRGREIRLNITRMRLEDAGVIIKDGEFYVKEGVKPIDEKVNRN